VGRSMGAWGMGGVAVCGWLLGVACRKAEVRQQVSKKQEKVTSSELTIFKDLSTAKFYAFDPKKGQRGEITYTLLVPARVRIKITAKNNYDLLYRDLIWDWREAGPHVEYWDGKDAAGNFLNPLECGVWTDIEPKFTFKPATFKPPNLTMEELMMGKQGAHQHNIHDPAKCGRAAVRFTEMISGAGAGSSAKGSRRFDKALSGVSIIRVEVSKDKRGYSDETNYGVRWTVDRKLTDTQYYDRSSDGKFEWKLKTTQFPDGEHTIGVHT